MEENDISNIIKSVIQGIKTEKESIGITSMNLALAKALIEKIEEKSKEMGVNAVIAVFNIAARPVAIHCMDDALIASYDIAFHKAYTAVAVKMSTFQLKSFSQPQGSLYGISHINGGQIVIFGGGEPLYYKDTLLGGIGISGGTEEQDTTLAEYAKNMIEEVMLWHLTKQK